MLKWRKPLSDSPQDFRVHYLNAHAADLFFICGSDGKYERIPAHKFILSPCDTFNTTCCEIRIDDVSADGFREFLRYFYFEECEPNIKLMEEVMHLAQKYHFDQYFDDCCEYLWQKLKFEDPVIIHRLATRFKLSELLLEIEDVMKKELTAHIIPKSHTSLRSIAASRSYRLFQCNVLYKFDHN